MEMKMYKGKMVILRPFDKKDPQNYRKEVLTKILLATTMPIDIIVALK